MNHFAIRLLLLAGLVIVQSNVGAQPLYNVVDSIRVAVENPTGFLAPGDSVQINVRVTNPVGSGLVLEQISDYKRDFSPVLDTTGWPAAGLYTLPEPCSSSLPCAIEGAFPLAEGESVLLAFQSINALETLAVDTVVGFTGIRLGFDTGEGNIDTYADSNVVYLVSADGSGDSSQFDEYVVELPPLVFPQAETSFYFPTTIDAGDHFNLRMTVTNTGTQPFARSAVEPFSEFFPLTPENGSFLVKRCISECELGLTGLLDPGESATLDLANYIYSDDLLQDSVLYIDNFSYTVIDTSGRQFSIVPEGLPLTVIVNGPESGPAVNPSRNVPDREPLQVVDFLSEGDSLLIHDPNSGFDWIRLDASRDIAYPVLLSLLDEVPELNGFELARSSQVQDLVLNYLHAQGVTATPFELVNTYPDINAVLYEFIDLFGVLMGSCWWNPFSNPKITRGIVVDKPGLRTPAVPNPVYSTISVQANNPSGYGSSYPRGVLHDTSPDPGSRCQATGYWLVRTHTPPPSFIPPGARYHKDELVIPALRLGAERLAVTMNFRNPVGGLLQVTGVDSSSDEALPDDAELNLETGELLLHRVMVETSRDQYVAIRLLLEYLPDSDPPTFLVKSAETSPEP